MESKTPITYQSSGVDPDKAARLLGNFAQFLKTRPRDPAILAGIGPFASCYSLKDLLKRFEDPILVTCCDGVGTKAKLALEWDGIDRLGEDLVAMNVNDLLCAGAQPLQFLDYYACGQLREEQLMPLLKSIQYGCELAGCSLVGGETAEMPGVYAGKDFDLAGFAVGVADRPNLLGPSRVRVGDRLVALPSSGFHSNGYSLVRKVVEREKLSPDGTTPFGGTWKQALLAPTIIYTGAVKTALPRLHALAHLTGGGLFENLPRVLPMGTEARIDSAKWNFPPLFTWIQEKAGLDTASMLSTFNCGVGLIAICAPADVPAIQASAREAGVSSWEIGTIEATHSGAAPVVSWT